jgi:hypothetical protein
MSTIISKLLAATMIAGPSDPDADRAGVNEQASTHSSSTVRMPSWASISSKPRLTSSSGRR